MQNSDYKKHYSDKIMAKSAYKLQEALRDGIIDIQFCKKGIENEKDSIALDGNFCIGNDIDVRCIRACSADRMAAGICIERVPVGSISVAQRIGGVLCGTSGLEQLCGVGSWNVDVSGGLLSDLGLSRFGRPDAGGSVAGNYRRCDRRNEESV